MNEAFEDKVATIEGLTAPQVDALPFSLFERQDKKTTKLLANSGATAEIDGRHRDYTYSFKEPVFISHIVVKLSNYKDFDRFEWRVVPEKGIEKSFTAYPKDDEINVNVDEICTEVTFVPPRAMLRDTKLQQISVYGFRKSETARFITFAYNLDDLKAEALKDIGAAQADAQKRLDEANAKAAELTSISEQTVAAATQLSEVEKSISSQSNKLNEITAKVGATAKQLEAMEGRIGAIRSEINVETLRKEALQKEEGTLESKLSELRENINLFPSEISGFVDQASNNTKLYLTYAFGPLFILCSMLLLLISGAVDLTTVITSNPNVNLAAIIVSRMPYVAVASAIVYASYRLARLFITEVMNINRQRLSLTQVSIIAKDISQAAESQLGFTIEQIYANRLKAKMSLLGDHIKHLISTEPELLFPENIFSPPPTNSIAPLRPRSRRNSSVVKKTDNEGASQ